MWNLMIHRRISTRCFESFCILLTADLPNPCNSITWGSVWHRVTGCGLLLVCHFGRCDANRLKKQVSRCGQFCHRVTKFWNFENKTVPFRGISRLPLSTPICNYYYGMNDWYIKYSAKFRAYWYSRDKISLGFIHIYAKLYIQINH